MTAQRLEGIRQSLHRQIIEYFETADYGRFNPKQPKVKLHEPTYSGEEVWRALECLLSTRVTMGEKVLGFERKIKDTFGSEHATLVNSGSSANLLAFAALSNPAFKRSLKPGDEVIVPALSWSTSVWPIIQMGLVPVIVDIDPKTLNLDLNEVTRALSPKTRAIVPIHVYGNPCDMRALMDLSRRRDLLVMEDCCEALGARFEGKSVGTFGDIGTYSFYFSHHITSLEGGVCLSQQLDLAELMRILRAHGWVRETQQREAYWAAHPDIDPKFLFVNIGYNLRMTEPQAAFGAVQLDKLESFVQVRADNARFWGEAFNDLRDFLGWQEAQPGGTHSWFGFPMWVQSGAPFSVGEFRRFLEASGIETRPIIAGNIAAQPALQYYAHRVVGDLSCANRIMKCGFTFGNHQAVDEKARQYVADCVKAFVSQRVALTA